MNTLSRGVVIKNVSFFQERLDDQKKIRKNKHFFLDMCPYFIYTATVAMKETLVTIKKNSPVGKAATAAAKHYGLDPQDFLEALVNATIERVMREERETKAQA